jgi:hypothetical protein
VVDGRRGRRGGDELLPGLVVGRGCVGHPERRPSEILQCEGEIDPKWR